jgi:hypothetical protein
MAMHYRRCVSDEDLAKFCLFFLDYKRDLHPAYSVIDALNVLHLYLTRPQAYLVQITDDNSRVIGASAYYHGTEEQEFNDKDVAFLDMAIMNRTYRGSRLFLNGLQFLVSQIEENHPEVQEIKLAALAENDHLCKMYAKITETSYIREGVVGEEKVFCVKLNKLKTIFKKYNRV